MTNGNQSTQVIIQPSTLIAELTIVSQIDARSNISLSTSSSYGLMALNSRLQRHARRPLLKILLLATCTRLLSLLYLLFIHPRLLGSQASFDLSAGHLAATVGQQEDDLGILTYVARWDALYFASIALNGYRHEQELAFLPGWPAAMRSAAEGARWISGGVDVGLRDVVLAGTILSNIASVVACVSLYSLTKLLHPTNPQLAQVVGVLYAIGPSPAVMTSPYTEPAFAALTFTGLWLVENAHTAARQRSLLKQAAYSSLGSLLLAGATSIRSLGILSVVVVAWRGVLDPLLRVRNMRQMMRILLHRKLGTSLTAAQCAAIISPFLAFQWVAYRDFCLVAAEAVMDSSSAQRRPWCEARIPLMYGWVQEHYWNVGFIRYWQIAQIPNFLLAAPILAISIWTSIRFIRRESPLHSRMAPYHLISAITTYILIFSAHTQIALRISTGGGLGVVVYMGAAQLLLRDKSSTRTGRMGKAWVRWSIVYGAVSLVLWAGFYPPA